MQPSGADMHPREVQETTSFFLDKVNTNGRIRVVKGVVSRMSVMDLVMAICKCDREQAQVMVKNALKSVNHGEKARRLLVERFKFPGLNQRPTLVVTLDEALQFIDCLPDKHTEEVKAYIRLQFSRYVCGEETMHEELDENAEHTDIFTEMARESVQQATASMPVKRGRGRPKGSKNKVRRVDSGGAGAVQAVPVGVPVRVGEAAVPSVTVFEKMVLEPPPEESLERVRGVIEVGNKFADMRLRHHQMTVEEKEKTIQERSKIVEMGELFLRMKAEGLQDCCRQMLASRSPF